jgi:hypothetical protein
LLLHEVVGALDSGGTDAFGNVGVDLSPNTEVGGTAFAASIGRASRREIWGSINLIQPLRSPTSCAAKPGAACSTSNFGILAQWF